MMPNKIDGTLIILVGKVNSEIYIISKNISYTNIAKEI